MRPPESYRGREQTYAKHFFLERYLERLAWNVFSRWDTITYVDGFSGPWKSQDEELRDTSFKIAIDRLSAVRDGHKQQGKSCTLRCFFCEADREAFTKLEQAVRGVANIKIEARNQPFESAVESIAQFVGNTFSLIFIDPTGWTGFALERIQPLLKLRGEVLINFMFDHVNRFLEHPEASVAASLSPLFGGDGWFDEYSAALASGLSRENAILSVYAGRLRARGGYAHVTWTRILKPLEDRTYFYLVYATRHWKGLVEFRAIERQSIDEQERVREAAKRVTQIDRTGQHDLFGKDIQLGMPSLFDKERHSQIALAVSKLKVFLTAQKTAKYSALIGVALQEPLVWSDDLKNIVEDWRAKGLIELDMRNPRQKAPDPKTVVRLVGSLD